MVIEVAQLTINADAAEGFAEVFAAAVPHVAGAHGFRSAQLTRSIESPLRFVLLVEWETLADHTEGFRGSPAFAEWRALVGPHFAEPPHVEHVEVVGSA
ncbi:antibiotic biosynthesis monooxygenase [Rhodococcus sp. X156]|uniref:antibiotic biosynthesis monooxygenase family protein n=1 Tax=Rhodococcus sp. X156 TaxID=2499145 RepID=UPI000FD6C261|nr:antibiotic biosynthesis monooxygenase [Rhodococcus sp. X156]